MAQLEYLQRKSDALDDTLSIDVLIGQAESQRALTGEKCGNAEYELAGMKRKLEYNENMLGGPHESPNKRIRKYSPCDHESILRTIQSQKAKELLVHR